MFLHKPGFVVNLESGKFGMGGFVQQDLCSGDISFSFILFRGFQLKTLLSCHRNSLRATALAEIAIFQLTVFDYLN